MSLPAITKTSAVKAHDLYEELVTRSQDLDTMCKLRK